MPSLATTSISSFKLARFSRPLRFNDPIVREQPECYSIRASLIDYIRQDLQELSRRLFYQRIYIFAKNKLDVEPPSLHSRPTPTVLPTHGGSYRSGRRSVISVTSARRDTLDFKILLQMELQHILMHDAENSISGDKPTGLFLYMGDYSLLMFECVEDIVGSFCNQLSVIADKYFYANKVFLTEDRTGETYFQNFHYRRAIPININEKFPPNTVTDVELMSQQHLTIKDKLHELCTTLAEEIQRGQESAVHSTLSSNKGTFTLWRNSLDFGEDLTPTTFNKLLPEVQRIELVLNCNRFYCNVQRRALMYNCIPGELDEKLHTWPIPYNYTPIGVFWHSPYDVNLTFSDYGKKEEQVQEKGSGSEGSEEKGA
uniref:Chorismate synthase n=1 Tax=Zeugodacus cucurbitae TaxID=28588 RepID=A0A0A1XGZ3_ZEUCU